MLGCIGCMTFCALLVIEIPLVTFEGGFQLLQQRRAHAQQLHQKDLMRQHASLVHVDLFDMEFGLWDEYSNITPLQLLVSLSIATGVEEDKIAVTPLGNHFFTVRVKSEGAWLLEEVNNEGSDFIQSLNAQTSDFAAKMVVSKTAAKVASSSKLRNGSSTADA